MKKIILMLSMGLFLYAFTMHVKVSVDSPMELVTEKAVAHASGGCANGPFTGCWPDCPLYKEYIQCPSGFYIIRCDCGPGTCTPFDQGFC